MKDAYSYPEYCDIAYDWDRTSECDFIEECVKRYSGHKADSVLDIACGTGIHLREFARRGYKAAGIDIKREMVDYVLKRAAGEGLDIACAQSDMKSFNLNRKFGCAICMLDSFRYLLTDAEILSHLKSVAGSLEEGELYIIDLWIPAGDKLPAGTGVPSGGRIGRWEDVSWSESRGEIRLEATYLQHSETFDPEGKTFDDELIFKVRSPRFNSTLTSRAKTRALVPEDFLRIIDNEGSFEFIGRFNNFDFEHKEAYNIRRIRTILVLKKRR